MQRSDKGGSNCYHLQLQMQGSSISGTVLKRDDIRNSNQTSRKKKKTNNCHNQRPWAELPVKFLDIISSHLRVTDYLKLGRVCKSWRLFVLATRQKFLTSQPPLVVCISSRAKKTCCFYDIFNNIRFETKLPYFGCQSYSGLSCGHIIMEDNPSNISLTNPLTGYSYHFSSMPPSNDCTYISDQTILASTIPYPDLLLVVLIKTHHIVRFCRSRDTYWSVYSFANHPWEIVDMVVFNARLFVITSDLQIGVLSLRSSVLLLLSLKYRPRLSCYSRFVASDEQLLVVDFSPAVRLAVYIIDFLRSEWVKVENLGDKSLFLGDMMTPRLCNTTKWGGRSNCLYYLPCKATKCFVYSLNGQFLQSITIIKGDKVVSPRMNCWYFLPQSYTIDAVIDDKYVAT